MKNMNLRDLCPSVSLGLFLLLCLLVSCAVKKTKEKPEGRQIHSHGQNPDQVINSQKVPTAPPPHLQKQSPSEKVESQELQKQKTQNTLENFEIEKSQHTKRYHPEKPTSKDKRQSVTKQEKASKRLGERRPLVDPLVEGEETTLNVKYFGFPLGEITIEVKPYVYIDTQRAYHFLIRSQFKKFLFLLYSMEASLETYVSYKNWIPLSAKMYRKDGQKTIESYSYFNWEEHKEIYLEKRQLDKGPQQKIKKEWSIEPLSQNPLSALYYLRLFPSEAQKKFSFTLSSKGKNILLTGQVLRSEKLKTPIGLLNTLVVNLEFQSTKPLSSWGDVKIWLTQDQRKRIVKIEWKAKIGRFIAKVKSIETHLTH